MSFLFDNDCITSNGSIVGAIFSCIKHMYCSAPYVKATTVFSAVIDWHGPVALALRQKDPEILNQKNTHITAPHSGGVLENTIMNDIHTPENV